MINPFYILFIYFFTIYWDFYSLIPILYYYNNKIHNILGFKKTFDISKEINENTIKLLIYQL